jgi:hypothetical protein
MPAQRLTRSKTLMLRSSRSPALAGSGVPVSNGNRQSSPEILLWEGVFTPSFTTPTRETEIIKTEPSTPDLPSLGMTFGRALRRERSVRFADVQAVLQFDRDENDLQPWMW